MMIELMKRAKTGADWPVQSIDNEREDPLARPYANVRARNYRELHGKEKKDYALQLDLLNIRTKEKK